ncbi:MAG TPA: hypothetical protein ENN03_08940 [bacterium]|nr:hypothetical protein [bacterium]
MRTVFHFAIAVACMLIFPFTADGQGERDLTRIRREIEELEKQIQSRQSMERDILQQIQDLDRQMGLRRTLIHEYEILEAKKRIDVKEIEKRINENNLAYQKLKDQVIRRMVFVYKRGRLVEWEILLSMKNLNQMMVWISYQKRIMENDDRHMRLLLEKRKHIESDRNELIHELQEIHRLVAKKAEERDALTQTRSQQEALLGQVREDQTILQKRLRQKQEAYKAILGQITQAETRRRVTAMPEDGKAFQALKGKMDWPVPGSLISKYGRYRDPELRTEEENLGIVIKAEERSMVRVVSDGTVTWVSWQRGMGNIVLVDHGGGYYTVYAHLDVVFVDNGDPLKRGDTIGRVGERQSMNGSNLHFEVWSGRNHLNPENWMRK